MTDDKTSRVESGTETRRQESSDLLLFHLKSAPVWPLLSTLLTLSIRACGTSERSEEGGGNQKVTDDKRSGTVEP